MAEKKPKTLVGVRIDDDDLAALVKIGQAAKPVPASQSQMIQVAVKEYVERNGKKPKKEA